MSFAPWRSRFLRREAKTGCASVGLAPIRIATSVCSTEFEILGAGRRSVSLAQAVAGRRMADARAGVDVVVAERGADQLLHQKRFLVGAARGRDAADRTAAVFLLDALEFGGDARDRRRPRTTSCHGIGNPVADHRLENAFAMRSVTPGEAALHAGMAAVRLAVLIGNHADDLVAAHFRLERTADAAIGAGRHHRMLGLADLDHRLFGERRRRAGLDAGAAGHAFRSQKRLLHAGRHDRIEAAAGDRQRKSALHLFAGAHATRADDAFGRLIGEIGVRLVLAGVRMLVAIVAVTHVAQADGTSHVLKLAIAVRRAG